jgi:hypothetical protein
MSIIVSTKGQSPARVPQKPLPNEDYLETYVATHPDVLPLDEIREGLTLVVLARQFSTLSGPVDVLAIDDEGCLYVIETKLYHNGDKRRVVAQMLDYGAAIAREIGATPDPVATLTAKLPNVDLRSKIAEEFGVEGETDSAADDVLDGLRDCLRDGTLKFIVLMDGLDDRLRDLILFVNEFSRFSVLAVEAKFYSHGDTEIVIPRLFGGERVKTSPQVRATVTEELFFKALGDKTQPPFVPPVATSTTH